MIITRYDLISSIIKNESGDNAMVYTEKDRSWLAGFPDYVLFTVFNKPQFKKIRKGYYTIN